MMDTLPKTLGVMQPYLFPYLGYFQLIEAVDEYVIYDDVQHIKRGWINRNSIRLNGERHRFTINLSGASQTRLINEVYISDNFEKLRRTIEIAYRKAPFWEPTEVLLAHIFEFEDRNLAHFAKHALDIICRYIGTNTPMILSSDVEKDNTLRGQTKILEICRKRGATKYVNPIGGRALYDKQAFAELGITLSFLEGQLPPYGDPFLPGLSIIDVLMHNSAAEVRRMLQQYALV